MRPDDVGHGRVAREHMRSGSRRVTDHLLHLGLGVTSLCGKVAALSLLR